GSGEEQEGAGRYPGEAAAGGRIRRGRLPDARAASAVERRHHQAVGHRGRSEREVGGVFLSEVVPGMLARKARMTARPLSPRDPPLPSRPGEGHVGQMPVISAPRNGLDRMSWAWVGVVPFFAFALMFLILPTGFLM